MTLDQRLEKLERENRWMRRIGMVAAAVAAAVFLIGQGKEKELPDLEVRSLKVKDEEGDTRIEARAGSMWFSTKDGTTLLSLGAGAHAGDTPAGHVWVGEHKKAQILLSALGDITAGLTMSAGESRPALGLAVSPDDAVAAAFDKNGKRRLLLGHKTTHATDERTGAKTKTAENTLVFFDANGKVIWKAPKD